MNKRRQAGFLIIWAELAVFLVLLLSGAFFMALSQALQYERDGEYAAERALLMQDIMERVKYEWQVRKAIPDVPREYERNSRRYRAALTAGPVMESGLLMEQVQCTVTDEKGKTCTAELLLGRAP